MSKFYRNKIEKSELESDNKPIQLIKCLDLIEKSEYKDQLIELLDFDSISKEYVTINGARIITNSVISKDDQYKKFDHKSHISNITYEPSEDINQVNLIFHNIDENDMSKTLTAQTIYNSKNDYFDGAYKLDKFANFCISEGHTELLQKNIEELNDFYREVKGLEKSYRLLFDNNEKSYYLRAITSTNRYFDYNIRFSLFVTIVALHKLQKEKKINFKIDYCEYDESYVKIFFEKEGMRNIPGVGKMKFMLEMSNDEIKRGSFKFSALVGITSNTPKTSFNVYAKPSKIKTDIVSIRHNFTPDTVIEHISKLDTFIKEAEEELRNDVEDLSKTKKPDELRFKLYRKIEGWRKTDGIELSDSLKKSMTAKLSKRIDNLSELLVMMDKVNELVTDLELKEYLRYVYYDILFSSKKKKED